MADKNIQMTQRNVENTDWENLHPITLSTNVKINDPETGKNYVWAIQGGLLGIKEV